MVFSNLFFNKKGIKVRANSYYIKPIRSNKFLFVNNNNIIIKKKQKHEEAMIWNLIQIKENQFLIQNNYNQKYIGISDYFFLSNNIYNKSFYFEFLKLFEEVKIKADLEIINKEPIDIVIKYIDVKDKQLNRSGIKHIYKDKDNDELKYSVRSILENIPWVRKIFILMPNLKVRFFKSEEEINGKIVYVKDKDLLGYDTANNVAFSFNLYKMEKFGVSKNFIYMDDDYFYGKPLKKSDFFYYDNINQKVIPYIIASKFQEINKTYVLKKYLEMFKNKDLIHPHSGKGFTLSILCTEKFFVEHSNISLIKTEHTHNAIPFNIEELKELFEIVKKYKYINETLKSKERYILRLSHQHSYNLYQLNIKHKKIHHIHYKYIQMENLKKYKLNIPLFVLNTGGNHIPLNRQYSIEKKIMRKVFINPNIYEIYDRKEKNNPKFFVIQIYLIFFFIKILLYFK